MILYVVLIQESADLIRETKVFNIRLIDFHFPIDGHNQRVNVIIEHGMISPTD